MPKQNARQRKAVDHARGHEAVAPGQDAVVEETIEGKGYRLFGIKLRQPRGKIRTVDYLIKPVAPEYLVWAVSEAAQGRPVLCGEVQTAVLGYLRRVGATTRCKALGWREREIMLLVMRGATNKDIARKLGIEAGTVHWYLNKVFKKMQVHSRDEARRRFAGGGVNSCSPWAG